MEFVDETNVRPYRIFMDSVGTGKKKKGFYIIKHGKRKYLKEGIDVKSPVKLIVNKKKYKNPKLNKKILKKAKKVYQKVVGDIFKPSISNSQVGRIVQESFKNIQGQVNRIGDITNVYNLQKDIGELKNEVHKESEKIDKIQTLFEKIKSGDADIKSVLKHETAKKIFDELMLDKDITVDKALEETFKKFQKHISDLDKKAEESQKELTSLVSQISKVKDEKQIIEDESEFLKIKHDARVKD